MQTSHRQKKTNTIGEIVLHTHFSVTVSKAHIARYFHEDGHTPFRGKIWPMRALETVT